MKLSLNDLIFLTDLIGGRPYQTEESDLFKKLEKERNKKTDSDLDDFNLIPYIRDLPWDVEEYCLVQGWNGTSTVIQVELRKENPLATWLKKQGYVFSSEEIRRGWGHIALMGA